MERSEDIINISELPENAKAELLDFLEFLKTKHTANRERKSKSEQPPLKRFVSKPIKVERIKKYSRDELHAR